MNINAGVQAVSVSAQFGRSDGNVVAERLTENQSEEVLAFLARRPLHAVILSGWIRDHGIVSPQHQGEFYGCWDGERNLVGVAIIGRKTLFEVRTDQAIIAFARCAKMCPDIRMLFAEESELVVFWLHYDGLAPMPSKYEFEIRFTTELGKLGMQKFSMRHGNRPTRIA